MKLTHCKLALLADTGGLRPSSFGFTMKVLRKKKFVLFEYFQRTFPMIGILSMFPASLARRVLDAPGIFGRQSSSSCYELDVEL